MRYGALWTLVLLGLPGIAVADGATGAAAEPVLPLGEPAIERAKPRTTSPPALDLRIDPRRLPWEGLATGPSAAEAERADRELGAEARSTDRGLSFGVEVRPRSRLGRLARDDDAGDPSLGDEFQKLFRQGTLGVRGRYRF